MLTKNLVGTIEHLQKFIGSNEITSRFGVDILFFNQLDYWSAVGCTNLHRKLQKRREESAVFERTAIKKKFIKVLLTEFFQQ